MTDKTAAPAKAPKAERVTMNGVVRPSAGTATGNVWTHADSISGTEKRPATRAEVLAACAADGINPSTAATQYGRWCKFNGVVKPKKEAKPKAEKKEAKPKAAPAKEAPVAGASDDDDAFEE